MDDKPRTFRELEAHRPKPVERCSRCRQKKATHTISMTVIDTDKGRGGLVTQMRQVPVCEPCAVDVFAAVQTGLRR